MARIVFLGTANAVSDRNQENSHLAAISGQKIVLVDCPGNPIVRLQEAGISPADISDVVLTHFHPDHVSGFPLLVMDLWLLGRKRELRVFGLDHTISRAETMLDLFGWKDWPNFYPLEFCRLPEEEGYLFLDSTDLRLLSSPGKHMIPSIAVRFEFPGDQGTAVYSSDTGPSEAVARLAQGVDVLIHEATGTGPGHSSALQAGQIAAEAQARQLYLIHHSGRATAGKLLDEARHAFSGPIELAEDFMEIRLGDDSPTGQIGLPLGVLS